MIAVKQTRGKAVKTDRLAKAIEDLERIERELARTQNRWQKARALVKRLEAKAEKDWAEQGQRLTPRAVEQQLNDDLDFGVED